MNTKLKDQLFGGIFGLAVADAVGVPVEFWSRESLRRNPVTDMQGNGTYDQPPGTWSDDTSLTLCLLDSLAEKGLVAGQEIDFDLSQPDYADIMQRFLSWWDEGKYSAYGECFDIGIATEKALRRFRNGAEPLKCGGTSERDNGNGSLMRILPIALYFPVIDRLYHGGEPSGCGEKSLFLSHYVHRVSSLTHAHKRSQIACGLYATIVRKLLSEPETDLKSTIHAGLKEGKMLYEEVLGSNNDEVAKELKHFYRLFDTEFARLPEDEIKSSGYVVDTLEAAIWSLLNTDNYRDCVLKAVNLGEDTDTVAAVAGGIAGIFYGLAGIPQEWLRQLAGRDYIGKILQRFYTKLPNPQ